MDFVKDLLAYSSRREEIQQVLNTIKSLNKFTTSKLHQDVAEGQEAALQEVVKRINKQSYQFHKKRSEEIFV